MEGINKYNSNIDNKFENKSEEIYRSKIIRLILLIIGTVSLALGIIGIFIPLLPTTPFLLLSAACYAKSSRKFYLWMMNNRYFGKYISKYKERKGIPLKIKIYSCSLLWLTILFSVLFVINNIIVKFLLVIIAVSVTYHIVSIKTLKENK